MARWVWPAFVGSTWDREGAFRLKSEEPEPRDKPAVRWLLKKVLTDPGVRAEVQVSEIQTVDSPLVPKDLY
jgi:hypothetical protein